VGQVIFVVCRESIEALLVIGILYAWLSHHPNGHRGKKWLFYGIVAGLLLAALLALTLVGITDFLGEGARTYFEIGMLFFASILIVQMVIWMRLHGRKIKQSISSQLAQRSTEKSTWFGVFFLTLIAVAREGSETVVFLYGSFIQLQTQAGYAQFFLAAAIGLALALLFFYVLQMGNRFISWRWFFRVTEVLLLFLGASLFLAASENLLSGPLALIDLPAWLSGVIWNTSSFIDDGSVFGNVLASLFAYRSRPIAWDMLMLALYWVSVLWVYRWYGKRADSIFLQGKASLSDA